MMMFDKVYRGDLTAMGGYVALERISGKRRGGEGTVLIHDTGATNKGRQSMSIHPASDAGTGDLKPIRSVIHIAWENHKHFYRFAYSPPAKGIAGK